jgi:hypothetical protein
MLVSTDRSESTDKVTAQNREEYKLIKQWEQKWEMVKVSFFYTDLTKLVKQTNKKVLIDRNEKESPHYSLF